MVILKPLVPEQKYGEVAQFGLKTEVDSFVSLFKVYDWLLEKDRIIILLAVWKIGNYWIYWSEICKLKSKNVSGKLKRKKEKCA